VGKPEERRPFGRPRCRWGDNIQTGLRQGERALPAFPRLKMGTNGGLLSARSLKKRAVASPAGNW
jgi:hypothetical protein